VWENQVKHIQRNVYASGGSQFVKIRATRFFGSG